MPAFLSRHRRHLWVPVFGFALGFSIGNIGFGDFGELNRMFTFRDLRMFFTFLGGVVVAGVLFQLTARDRPPAARIHRGVVPGAVLFGSGWAISGGCPAIPLVQLGTGYLPAVVTIAGIAVGMRAYRILNARYLHLDTGACSV